MPELVYMRESCTAPEFYDALELLCVKYGAAVVLTAVMSTGAHDQVAAELGRRGMHSRHEGSRLDVWGKE